MERKAPPPNNSARPQNKSTAPTQGSSANRRPPPKKNQNYGRHQRPFHKNNQNPVRSPTTAQPLESVFLQYDRLLTQHNLARKAYFDEFSYAEYSRVDKLERQFNNTMDALRNFEKNLKPHEKEYLNSRINFYKEDKTYLQNHQDDPAILAPVAPTTPENPHLLISQKEAQKNYAQDTEESSGSMDDYNKL
nr:hypothetical protein [Bacteriovoracaceae bacterium]